MRRANLCTSMLTALLVFGGTAEAALLNRTTVLNQASEGNGDPPYEGGPFASFDEEIFDAAPVILPTHATLSAAKGPSFSAATVDWVMNGGQATFSLGMDHRRTNGKYPYAATDHYTYFTADTNDFYELSGFYRATEVTNHGATGVTYTYLSATLLDATTSIVVFQSEQSSTRTPNQQFILGGKAADSSNILQGSLKGNLIVGHTYRLNTSVSIASAFNPSDSPAGSTGATALGNITLKLGTVPEPSSIFLLGMGGDQPVRLQKN